MTDLLLEDDLFGGLDLSPEDKVSFAMSLRSVFPRRWEGSLWDWGFEYVPHYLTKDPSDMHLWLSDQLGDFHEERGQRMAVLGPRGSAKSTWASFIYALFCAVEGIEPYIFIVSDTASQANLFIEAIQGELESNWALADAYPESVGIGPVWRQNTIQLNNGTTIEGLGTGSRIRGRRRRQERPTLIIGDDLENDDHAASAVMRERSNNWFNKALLKAGTPRTNVIVLGTALHRECIIMRLVKTVPGWKRKEFKAIEEWPTRMDLWAEWEEIYCDIDDADAPDKASKYYKKNKKKLHEGSKVLWEAEEDLLTLMKMRVEEGRTAFEAEKQGNPINPESCEWPEDYFGPDIWFSEWPKGPYQVRIIALDPSKGKDAKKGDYSAFIKFGRHKGTIYIEADLQRRPVPQIIADGVGHWLSFPCDGFAVESNQFQELLQDDFIRACEEAGILEMPIFGLDNRVNKLVRIRRLGPYLSKKRFRFKTNSPGTRLLVNQLKDFPVGDHDDGPDALEMALRLAIQIYNNQATEQQPRTFFQFN